MKASVTEEILCFAGKGVFHAPGTPKSSVIEEYFVGSGEGVSCIVGSLTALVNETKASFVGNGVGVSCIVDSLKALVSAALMVTGKKLVLFLVSVVQIFYGSDI